MTVHQAARLLAAIVMALATAAAVWLVVPPLARRIITGDYGWCVVPTDARSGLWYPTAAWQPLTDPEILTLWFAAAGAALLVCLTTLRLMGWPAMMTVHKVGALDTAWHADYLSSSLVGAVAGQRAISRMSTTLSTSRSVRPR